jgi:hypothetical protein
MLVATNADSVVEQWDVEGTWTARRADTNLSTGEIMLGVDELGSATSTMEGPGLVDYPWNYVGLRHLASGTELSALGAPTMWSGQLTDSSSAETMVNGAWWSTAKVDSFTYSSDHARAEVSSGGYTFVHEYSATSDPEVIRCDVTITASSSEPFGTEVRYRLGGRALTDPHATTWLTATRDATDTSIVHMNTLGMNYVDDPREYWLPPYETEAPFAARESAEPQMDIQTHAQQIPAFQPNFTFFYSASDQGETGARAAVAQLGATSVFSYKLVDAQDATLPVGFAIGYLP